MIDYNGVVDGSFNYQDFRAWLRTGGYSVLSSHCRFMQDWAGSGCAVARRMQIEACSLNDKSVSTIFLFIEERTA